MAFGGDPVYLTCDARCKGPGATPALGWYKGKSQMPLPSTRGRISSYSRSSNRVQRLIIRYFIQRDIGWYTCKGWLGPDLKWMKKSIWLQMGCTHPMISCDVRRCLPEKYRCDGVRHCEDGFDEYECGPDSCNESEFYCDGRCHDIKIRCNTEPDCYDYLDEMDCTEEREPIWVPDTDNEYDYEDYNTTETTMTTTAECNTDLYQCPDGPCIPWDYVCDGVPDCPHGDDEWDCWGPTSDQQTIETTTPSIETTTIAVETDHEDNRTTSSPSPIAPENCASRDHFQCWDGRCISLVWVCNGMEDCEGGDDELNCGSTTETTEQPITTEATTRSMTTEATARPRTTEARERPRTTFAMDRPATAEATERPGTTEATERPTTTEATERRTATKATERPRTTGVTERPRQTGQSTTARATCNNR